MLIVPPVQNAQITEGYIADSHIEEAVGHIHFLKAVYRDPAVLIKLLCDPAGNAVDLHAVGAAFCHALRQHSDEVSYAAGGL